MGEDSTVRRMAIRQRQRLMAGLLGAAERSAWWPKLSAEEKRSYREEVIVTLNPYHEFMLDLIGISAEDVTRNEAAVELLQAVHDSQRRIERRGERVSGG